MGFKTFVGLDKYIESIQRGLKADTINHAYLFYGPEGSGKLTFALILAQALNCLNDTEDPCSNCISCRKIAKGIHPDVSLITPEGTRVKIEAVRKIKASSSYRPHEGRKKICIIKDADLLSLPAANSLLKILEEPPLYQVFILLTTNINRVIPTIFSRCQRISFNRISASKIYSFLERQDWDYSPSELKTAANVADGNIGRALNILNSPDWKDKRKKYLQLSKKYISEFKENIIFLAEELAEEEDLKEFIDFLESYLRDCLVYQNTGEEDLLINIDCLEEIKETRYIYYTDLLRMIKEIKKFKEIIGLPVNKKLALECLLFKMKGVK